MMATMLVDGLALCHGRLARRAAADDHHDFPLACADGVDGDEKAALLLPGLNVDGA